MNINDKSKQIQVSIVAGESNFTFAYGVLEPDASPHLYALHLKIKKSDRLIVTGKFKSMVDSNESILGFLGGDSWYMWGEKSASPLDVALHVWYRAEDDTGAVRSGFGLASMVDVNMVPHIAISKGRDWADTIV